MILYNIQYTCYRKFLNLSNKMLKLFFSDCRKFYDEKTLDRRLGKTLIEVANLNSKEITSKHS